MNITRLYESYVCVLFIIYACISCYALYIHSVGASQTYDEKTSQGNP